MFIWVWVNLTQNNDWSDYVSCSMTRETISGFLGDDCMTIAEAVVTIGCMLTLHIVSLVLRRLGTPGLRRLGTMYVYAQKKTRCHVCIPKSSRSMACMFIYVHICSYVHSRKVVFFRTSTIHWTGLPPTSTTIFDLPPVWARRKSVPKHGWNRGKWRIRRSSWTMWFKRKVPWP